MVNGGNIPGRVENFAREIFKQWEKFARENFETTGKILKLDLNYQKNI